ncbi:MAG: cysteine desulfurase family protein [Peptococcaceae bacterium]|nr:cysteine desulfurase family protein [Peptococcaceae bacterium]
MRMPYFDHSATTPVRPEVWEAMAPFLRERFGNPSSFHAFGRTARQALEEAREKTAALIDASPDGIVFTSGGTEAVNTAVIGVARSLADRGRHIITSGVEHHASLDSARALAEEGFEVTVLPVDGYGLVHPDQVREALTGGTILVNIMHANNEVGTVMPVEEIGALTREKGIVFHCDAVQTAGKLPLSVDRLNVDLLSLSAHKFNGPKGTGALYVRKGTPWKPLLHGGSQERARRAGTENVAGIVGMGRAAELAGRDMEGESARCRVLRDRLIEGMLGLPDVVLTGHPVRRLPMHASFCLAGVEGEAVLLGLDMKGIAASSGSACTSGAMEPSYVLTAMGIDTRLARGALRLTLGLGNTGDEIEACLREIGPLVARLRSMSPLAGAC